MKNKKLNIDKERRGFAGAHDIIDGANINRDLKKNEILHNFKQKIH